MSHQAKDPAQRDGIDGKAIAWGRRSTELLCGTDSREAAV
jgi:hypothetical protein